jgi:hypothetical protein
MKSKESQYQKGQYVKIKLEKKIHRLEDLIQKQETQLIEKDKECRLLVLKLKEVIK